MKTKHKKFTINNKVTPTYSNDELYITGIANTGKEDLIGETVTINALKEIAQQIPKHNLHLDHGQGIEDILGPLISGKVTEQGLEYKAKIINEKKEFIKSLLDQGVNLGSSISGQCEYEEGSNTNISSWTLTEISLTGIPCDQNTMATVHQSKSFDNILETIKNKQETPNNGGITMPEEKPITEENIIQIVNDAITELKDDLTQTIKEELETEFITQEEFTTTLNEIKQNNDNEQTTENEEKENKPEDDKEDEEEEKANTTSEEEEDTETNPENDKEDEEKKNLNKLVEKKVNQEIRQIFKNLNNNVTTKYQPKPEPKQKTKNTYTPEELAKMM